LAALGATSLAAVVGRLPVLPGSEPRQFVPHHRQRHTLSCEMAALRMVAGYYRRRVTEDALIEILPFHGEQPRLEGATMIWGDPNQGFVGSVDGKQIYREALEEHPPEKKRVWEWGYGVYPKPIAEVAARLNLPAYLLDSLDDVYRHLARGNPVIAIVPSGGDTRATRWWWYTERGDRITVIDREHAVVLEPRYNDDYVYVNDSALYAGDEVFKYRHDDLARAFGVLSMAVAIGAPRWTIPLNAVQL
jgi:uncharacterized protein YvpB